ncbi:MAG: LysM peptidoglycan-binding domain-containing protein [Anaerolineaceae bacterium]|nr:LysM peptidoglycan-binding domain-containing protein [Anaerolineaceae bacterium]
MHKNLFALLLTAVMLITVLSACVLPASQAPKATLASSTEMPFPLVTQGGNLTDILSGTQTAAAINSAQAAATSTSVPNVQTTPMATTATVKAKATAKPTKVPKPTKTPKPYVAEASPTSPVRPTTYTVQHGDYLICIARRFDLNLTDLFNDNGMNIYSRPSTGTVLQIPQNDSWNTAFGPRMWHSHPTQYTVKSGDNVNTIACYFGDVYPDAILAANNLKGAYTLSTGQAINIP